MRTWTTTDIPDQTGRIAVITGGNGGLGFETARALAGAGAHVVIAARDEVKTAGAVARLRTAEPNAVVDVLPIDLASLDSVRAAAAQLVERYPAIDLLVNNAGVMAVAEATTADGFERQFGTNHLGHWALTALVLPHMRRVAGSRIVTVTSTAHHIGRAVDPENPHLHGTYRPWKAYGQSKLANYHFAIGLHRLLRDAGSPIASLMAHPGLANTDLQAVSVEGSDGGRSQRLAHRLADLVGMTAADGALPQIRAATDPAARSGQLYAPRWMNSGPPVRRPVLRRLGLDSAIERLWTVSERETGIGLGAATVLDSVG